MKPSVVFSNASGGEILHDTPLARSAPPHGTQAVQTAPPGQPLLIVEDEPAIARVLERLLTRAGYHVEVATNGQEALAACHRRAYTQILCDLWMPIIDGQDFYYALQRSQPDLCARVVFLTGDTLTPALQAFLQQVQVPVLVKPFTAARLYALLSARCSKSLPA